MFDLELEIHGKQLKTEFMFDGLHEQLARRVLSLLEFKTIDVPDPGREWEPPWDESEIDPSKFVSIFVRYRSWPAEI